MNFVQLRKKKVGENVLSAEVQYLAALTGDSGYEIFYRVAP